MNRYSDHDSHKYNATQTSVMSIAKSICHWIQVHSWQTVREFLLYCWRDTFLWCINWLLLPLCMLTIKGFATWRVLVRRFSTYFSINAIQLKHQKNNRWAYNTNFLWRTPPRTNKPVNCTLATEQHSWSAALGCFSVDSYSPDWNRYLAGRGFSLLCGRPANMS